MSAMGERERTAHTWMVESVHRFPDGEQDVQCRHLLPQDDTIATLLPAIEYHIQAGDTIEFHLSDPDTWSEFRINDTGPWIPKSWARHTLARKDDPRLK